MTPALADLIAFVIMSERPVIERALQRVGVTDDDAEDVAQDVLVLAVQAAQHGRLRWEDRDTLRRWLYVVAFRFGVAHLQRVQVRARYEGTHENEPVAPSAEDRYLVRETLAIAARSTTPERWKTLRAFASGIDVADIARREGLTVPGVYNRIRLARADIRAALARADMRRPGALRIKQT